MSTYNHQGGIENEPQYLAEEFSGDPAEEKAAHLLALERKRMTEADAVEHTVWSEPALSSQLAGQPDDEQLTYQRWLLGNVRKTTWAKSYAAVLMIALAAGPWGILGAIASAGASSWAYLMMIVFGPVAEEVAKVAAALWVVEKRPFLFRSRSQILLCAACGGLAFAAIENILYTHVYYPVHTIQFVAFRWTVCVGLHVSCSLVAGLGLVRIWDNAIRNQHRPQLALGVPWLVIAMVGHGLYNLLALLAQTAGWLDLGMPTSSNQ
jgi:hypothetical protein